MHHSSSVAEIPFNSGFVVIRESQVTHYLVHTVLIAARGPDCALFWKPGSPVHSRHCDVTVSINCRRQEVSILIRTKSWRIAASNFTCTRTHGSRSWIGIWLQFPALVCINALAAWIASAAWAREGISFIVGRNTLASNTSWRWEVESLHDAVSIELLSAMRLLYLPNCEAQSFGPLPWQGGFNNLRHARVDFAYRLPYSQKAS
jgi:hypothetical protein